MNSSIAPVPDRPDGTGRRVVARALAVIGERYSDPIDIEMLAREAGVSRSVLALRFQQAFGCPPMRYCYRYRLDRAAEILRSEGTTAAETAFRVGFGSEAAFNRAFKRHHGETPIAWQRARRRMAAAYPLPPQTIAHCHANDGTRIAWSQMGEGFPLIKTANWLNHLELDWTSPVWRHWLAALSSRHRLIRYDERGNGLSDWETPSFSLAAFVDDFEAVVDAAGLERFDIVALSQGAAVAISYAVRHPHRVRRMVLAGGYARGWRLRLSGEDYARREAMVTLSRTGWGTNSAAFRQVFTSLYIPGGTAEQFGWWNELQRLTTSPQNAERLQMALGLIDVSGLLSRVTVPVLVAHSLRDQVIPFSAGEDLARCIPGARFLPLDSDNHVLLDHEPAWPVFRDAVDSFLAG
ncbi:alpha/beta fold hydrolase [Tsuneonella sp. SYSU-LHT278]|uniref:alpha/beta fold hydrolase n=1 Tax=Tsuneonella sediminis TaxID=3416089 RepID=UPI003F7A0210